ncbi:unnamed protein product, partial [Meganyctiphanes norvegica]
VTVCTGLNKPPCPGDCVHHQHGCRDKGRLVINGGLCPRDPAEVKCCAPSRYQVAQDALHVMDKERFFIYGYVPTSGSGVTISSGVDLGQHDEAGLRRTKISEPLIQKLKKSGFLGKKTKREVDKVGDPLGLVLTLDEAWDLHEKFMDQSRQKILPYTRNMSVKGRSVLISLTIWCGSIENANTKCRASRNTEHVLWNAIYANNQNNASDQALSNALGELLILHNSSTDPNKTYRQRITKEIMYLSKRDKREL